MSDKKQFIREKEVSSVLESTDGKNVTATFADGSASTFKKEAFAALVTEEPLDASKFRDHAMKAKLEEILAGLIGWNLQLSEIAFTADCLHRHIQAKADEAVAIAFGVYPARQESLTFEGLSSIHASYKKPEAKA